VCRKIQESATNLEMEKFEGSEADTIELQIINVKAKRSPGSLSISKSQLEVGPQHPQLMFNCLMPEHAALYRFCVLSTLPN